MIESDSNFIKVPMNLPKHLLLLLLTTHLIACDKKSFSTLEKEKNIKIYVVSQGWHTGIVVPTNCIADSLWTEGYPYHKFNYVLIGWGDADYYQTKGFNLWYASKAAVWPTSSTLHVKAFNQLSNINNLTEEIVDLLIGESDYSSLCNFIQSEFQLDNDGLFIPQTAGFYRNSHFFAGNNKYTAINNSNVWTGKAMKKAGFKVNPYCYPTQKSLIKKLKNLKID